MSRNPRHALTRAGVFVASLAVVGSGMLTVAAPHVAAVSPNVVISQVYGGGGNSGGVYTNDFIELFNRGTATADLTGWSIQYASATGTGNFGSGESQITPLSGSLAAGHYLLVQEAAGNTVIAPLPTPDLTDATPIGMSGTGGKVALANIDTSLGCNGGSTPCSATQLAQIVDLVGWDGANFYEGTAPAPATTNSTAVLRANGGCTDTDNNSADFTVGAPTPRNTASPAHYCTGPTDPSGVGTASPNTLFAGDATLLRVAVTPGSFPTSTDLGVTCDLSPIGGSASQSLYDDGTNGDVTAADNTFSFSTTVDAGTTGGTKSLACTLGDAQSRSGSASIALTVLVILPIGTVNGAVLATDDGATHRSPFAPVTGNGSGSTVVTVQGVIYEKTLQATGGDPYNGFYIQNTSATTDGDPNTSDGLFVYEGKYNDISDGAGGYYTPEIGDEIVVSGKVSEYYNMTELSSSLKLVKVVHTSVNIDAEVPPVVANPPVALADANRYWERLQGMRVQVPEGSVVLGGRNVFSPADAEIWVAGPDSTIAQRTAKYTDRAFRDANPLDDNYDPTVWDGNGYRILMGSLGIKAAADDAQTLIDPARTFDTVTNAPAGGLNYTYSKYRIEISEQPTFALGPDPAQNNPPQVIDRSTQYSIVDYNLENLYDYRDNPFSGCDFNTASNTGCSNAGTPFIDPVTPASSGPRFNYVPASEAAYQARLTDIALQIVDDLHSPDILMVQEVENQDICSVVDGAMACGTTDNADGKPDVLQDLALKVAADGGPSYDAAFDRDSSDLRGIAPAYLYRTDRVQLLPAAGDPVLGTDPAIGTYTPVPYDSQVSNPKTLNAVLPAGVPACETSWVFPRAPDIALFGIWSSSIGVGTRTDVYTINNHFKSGPDSCVEHRTEQAKYDAALVQYIETAVPGARVVVAGDLNVYPRPDDPFAPIGQAGSSDQLGSLYAPSLGLTNLWDVLESQAPEAAYSYVYLGQAQTLDQMFVNHAMLASLEQFRIAHINSDFPADYAGDVARGTSDHDPNVGVFATVKFPFAGFFSPVKAAPAVNTVKAGQTVPLKFSLGGNRGTDIFDSAPTVSLGTCPAGTGTSVAAEGRLHYDASADQYVFTWNTSKTWAGKCAVFSLKLVDGTTHEASFMFTR